MIKNVLRSSCKVFLLDLMKLDFSRQVVEKILNPSGRGGSCSMQTDGQTNTTKLIVAFRNFANAPNNQLTFVNNNFAVGFGSCILGRILELLCSGKISR
jgi:hypothetical protein